MLGPESLADPNCSNLPTDRPLVFSNLVGTSHALADIEFNNECPIFGYQAVCEPEAQRGFLREPLGWSPADKQKYLRRFIDTPTVDLKLSASASLTYLLNDAVWGAFDGYFGTRANLRTFLRGRVGRRIRTRDWICIKCRLYPPVNFKGDNAEFVSAWDRKREVPKDHSFDQRLVVVTGVNDLRLLGVDVSRGISWERTTQHLLEAMEGRFAKACAIPGIMEAKYVVVSFGPDGIILLTRETVPDCSEGASTTSELLDFKATLIFCGSTIEGDSDRRSTGRAYGGSTWLATLVAARLASLEPGYLPGHEWWEQTLSGILAYVRRLSERGNDLVPDNDDFRSFGGKSAMLEWDLKPEGDERFLVFEDPETWLSDERVNALAERERISAITVSFRKLLLDRSSGYAECKRALMHQASRRPVDHFEKTWWSFLSQAIRDDVDRKLGRLAGSEEVEAEYVRYAYEVPKYGGPGEYEYFPYRIRFPYAKFGNLITCDRGEIESVRNLFLVMQEYLDREQTKPLNIGVFGPPGAGKSYGIKALVKSLDTKNRQVRELEFNLSQITSPASLASCFQTVQDVILDGKFPVVFWDEFDTTLNEVPFGWLHWFLAPMQDGVFLHDGRLNHLGACLFIFAGSRFHRFEDLPEPTFAVGQPRREIIVLTSQEAREMDLSSDTVPSSAAASRRSARMSLATRQEQWRAAKGDDFRSRLRAYLNVEDCNMRMDYETASRRPSPLRFDADSPITCDQFNFLFKRARMIREKLAQLVELFAEHRFEDIGVDRRGQYKVCVSDDRRFYRELKISNAIAFGFLSPRSFVHGMRSIEAVLFTSTLKGKTRFERAWIPPADVMSIHIDPTAFEEFTADGLDEVSKYIERWKQVYDEAIEQRLPLTVPRLVVRKVRGFPVLLYDAFKWSSSSGAVADRVKIMISASGDTSRMGSWWPVAIDRGSPYLMNPIEHVFRKIWGDAITGLVDSYIAIRWRRGDEAGPLSDPIGLQFEFKRDTDEQKVVFDLSRVEEWQGESNIPEHILMSDAPFWREVFMSVVRRYLRPEVPLSEFVGVRPSKEDISPTALVDASRISPESNRINFHPLRHAEMCTLSLLEILRETSNNILTERRSVSDR
jgi:hypothetical protein